MRPPRSLLVLATLLALLAHGAHALGDVDRSAFAPVVGDLIERTFAAVVPCDLVVDRSTVCFRLDPGSVALVAEGLEAMLKEYEGALIRSAWQSGNGVHRVDLLLDDDLWGVLELWLSEPGDRSVAGMFKYVTRRRGHQP